MMRYVARLAVSVAVAVVSAVGASISAAAFGMGVGPGPGVGVALTGSCDRDGVTTSFVTAFRPTVGYLVTEVQVTGVDAACRGRTVRVAIADDAGRPIVESLPAAVDGAALTVAIGEAVPAWSIGQIYAMIT